MPLPNFLIIGAQKSGTSWLAHKLDGHPEVFVAKREIHCFDKDYNYSKGVGWYESHFLEASDYKAVGEKTPDYIWANGNGVEGHLPDVHKNIADVLPEARLIVVMRNPVTRAISAVNHIVRSGRISPFMSIDDLLLGRRRHMVEGHGVLDYGFYFRHISSYLEHFNQDRMLFLIYEEDVISDPDSGLRKVCTFLGIDPNHVFNEMRAKVNSPRRSRIGMAAGYYLPMLRGKIRKLEMLMPLGNAYFRPNDRTIKALYRLYAEENEKLFSFLGRRVPDWGKEELVEA